MRVSYDPKTDTLTVILRSDTKVAESDEDKPGVILDYDESGNLVAIEILDASQRVTEARKIEFQTMKRSPRRGRLRGEHLGGRPGNGARSLS